MKNEPISPLNPSTLQRAVAEQLTEGEFAGIGPDDNLIELGLDSVRIMRFAVRLRHSGATVSFGQLIGSPTLGAWTRLVCQDEPVHE